MNNLEIAQNKAKLEIEKSIQIIEDVCANFTGYGELLFFIYYLHLSRISINVSKKEIEDKAYSSFDDVCKYLISCILKYGKKEFISNGNSQKINIEVTSFLIKRVLHMNSNYESIFLLSLFDDIQLLGERNQHVKIDLSKFRENSNYEFLQYGNRLHEQLQVHKGNLLDPKKCFKILKEEFTLYDDLIINEFGLRVHDIVNIFSFIIEYSQNKLEENIINCPIDENGNIESQSVSTLISVVESFYINAEMIEDKFGKNGIRLLDKFTFNKNKFNIKELGYHYILRQPIIRQGIFYIISPQLFLDSLFVNFHYTLLESKTTRHEYKKISANYFINKIVSIANQHNYKEIKRELELYSGKKQLGDIDLVLYNEKINQFILVEAKNHSLPLSVYFGDLLSSQKHLEYLKSKWEDKVAIRVDHLKNNFEDYDIGKNYKYIIVSKYPEILSHYSNFLVLSLEEYEYYMKNIDSDYSFKNIYDNLYENASWDTEDMKIFMKDFTNFSFEQPK